MKIKIINKMVSLGGSSKVLDEQDKPLLKVKGKFFTMTRKKWVRELDGKKLYMVRQKLISPIHHINYIFDAEGNRLSEVSSGFLTFSDKASITSSFGPINIEQGGSWGDYDILVKGEKVGSVTRQAFSMTNSFLLDIDESKYDWRYFVALVIALDNIRDKKQSS